MKKGRYTREQKGRKKSTENSNYEGKSVTSYPRGTDKPNEQATTTTPLFLTALSLTAFSVAPGLYHFRSYRDNISEGNEKQSLRQKQ